MAFIENVNGYLTRLAGKAVLSGTEKISIGLSVKTLKQRLNAHFAGELSDHLIFGSYSRGTILPRSMDERSDVDYMVIFSDGNYQPQTYLDKLRRFVETHYSRSEIVQSHPTIQLILGHIRFELVPATKDWFDGLKIPAKASDYAKWVDTDPIGFNTTLISKNQEYAQLIKPLVRIVKYWNARSGYPFESYALEQQVVSQNYNSWNIFDTTPPSLKSCFYIFMDSLDTGYYIPQWKRQRIDHAKNIITSAKAYESSGSSLQAAHVIRQLLPMN